MHAAKQVHAGSLPEPRSLPRTRPPLLGEPQCRGRGRDLRHREPWKDIVNRHWPARGRISEPRDASPADALGTDDDDHDPWDAPTDRVPHSLLEVTSGIAI